jgi:hypothetical protein
MVKAVNIDAVFDYVCKDDKGLPKEEQTTWKIGVLDSLTMADVSQMDVSFDPGSKEQCVRANIAGRELDYVRYGLKGWDNFKKANGEDIKPRFNTISKGGRPAQVLHDDCLRQIPPKIIRELSEVILNENGLSESGEKN